MKSKLLIALILILMTKYSLTQVESFTEPIKTINDSSLYLHSKSVLPYTIESQALGSLVGVDRTIKQANLTPYPELNRIIWFESNNNPEAQNPNSSAFGLCQMIKSTREWVARDVFNETRYVIDYNNIHDQVKACVFLYENGRL